MPSKLSDAELMQLLQERYKPTLVPSCRVCDAPLRVVAVGGGLTKYACSTQGLGPDYPPIDWKHYECSEWSDYRQGGDAEVLELLRRFQKRTVSAAADNWTSVATPPKLQSPEDSPYGWPSSIPVLVKYRETGKQAVGTFEHVDEDEEPRWFTNCSERWNITDQVEFWRLLPE